VPKKTTTSKDHATGGALVRVESDAKSLALFAPPNAENDPHWQAATTSATVSQFELHLIRFLLDRAVKDGAAVGTIASLTALSAKLVECVRKEREEDDQRLDVEEVTAMAQSMAAAVRAVLEENKVPAWEQLLDQIAHKWKEIHESIGS
jgi:hypothetical protein